MAYSSFFRRLGRNDKTMLRTYSKLPQVEKPAVPQCNCQSGAFNPNCAYSTLKEKLADHVKKVGDSRALQHQDMLQ